MWYSGPHGVGPRDTACSRIGEVAGVPWPLSVWECGEVT